MNIHIVDNKYSNDERSIELRDWCNANVGRTKSLNSLVLGGCGLSHYKNGRNRINDPLWKRIVKEMKNIESHERILGKRLRPNKRISTFLHSNKSIIYNNAKIHFRSSVNLKFFNDHFGTDITLDTIADHREFLSSNFKEYYESVFLNDGKNVISDDKVDVIKNWVKDNRKVKLRLANIVFGYNYRKNCFDMGFSNIISKLENDKKIKVSNYNRCLSVIQKVDEMIKNNHAIAIAASK